MEQCWGEHLGFCHFDTRYYLQSVAITPLALKKSCHYRVRQKLVEISHCGKVFPPAPLLPVDSPTSAIQMFDLPLLLEKKKKYVTSSEEGILPHVTLRSIFSRFA